MTELIKEVLVTEDDGEKWYPYTKRELYDIIATPEENAPKRWVFFDGKLYSWSELQRGQAYHHVIFGALPSYENRSQPFLDRHISIRDIGYILGNLGKRIYKIQPLVFVANIVHKPLLVISKRAKKSTVMKRANRAIADMNTSIMTLRNSADSLTNTAVNHEIDLEESISVHQDTGSDSQ